MLHKGSNGTALLTAKRQQGGPFLLAKKCHLFTLNLPLTGWWPTEPAVMIFLPCGVSA